MIQPKVSICIPTYKQVNYLQRTIDSVLKQDYTDFELVITDDSPDGSVKNLLDKYDFKGKLKYYKNTNPLGSPENWNECVRKASGELIKILHHDDWFTESYSLKKFVDALDDPKIGFVFSMTSSINSKLKTETRHVVDEKFLQDLKNDPSILFFGNLIGPPSSVMYRKSNGIKFDTKLKWVVDIDFYIQCLLMNKNFIFLTDALITSVNNAEHSVTNDCVNKEVEVYEYAYLYKKIGGQKRISSRYVDFFRHLFHRYNVSKNEVKELLRELKPDKNIRLALLRNKVGI